MNVTPKNEKLSRLYAGLDADTIAMIKGKHRPGYKGELLSLVLMFSVTMLVYLVLI